MKKVIILLCLTILLSNLFIFNLGQSEKIKQREEDYIYISGSLSGEYYNYNNETIIYITTYSYNCTVLLDNCTIFFRYVGYYYYYCYSELSWKNNNILAQNGRNYTFQFYRLNSSYFYNLTFDEHCTEILSDFDSNINLIDCIVNPSIMAGYFNITYHADINLTTDFHPLESYQIMVTNNQNETILYNNPSTMKLITYSGNSSGQFDHNPFNFTIITEYGNYTFTKNITKRSYFDFFIDVDADDDGYPDINDIFPNDPTEWSDHDNDGIGDNADLDDDNDGYNDTIEDQVGTDPFDNQSIPEDFDDDGIPDILDLDDDNDGYPDINDTFPYNSTEWLDTDNDGIGNNADTDDDNDGWNDTVELECGSDPLEDSSTPQDNDNDTIPDLLDPDDDNDGYHDDIDVFPLNSTEWNDTDDDSIGDNSDTDDDGDGWNDTIEVLCGTGPLDAQSFPIDNDGDNIPDQLDDDWDNDGFNNSLELFALTDPNSTEEYPRDLDGDGIWDNLDDDIDGDGFNNTDEIKNSTDPRDPTDYPVIIPPDNNTEPQNNTDMNDTPPANNDSKDPENGATSNKIADADSFFGSTSSIVVIIISAIVIIGLLLVLVYTLITKSERVEELREALKTANTKKTEPEVIIKEKIIEKPMYYQVPQKPPEKIIIEKEPKDTRTPYEILGIPEPATKEEIKKAYKKKMLKYHPDKVNLLGDKLKETAHEESKKIITAYKKLTADGPDV